MNKIIFMKVSGWLFFLAFATLAAPLPPGSLDDTFVVTNAFTNCVPIKDGIVLSITDNDEGADMNQLLNDRSLDAETPLMVLIHETGFIQSAILVPNDPKFYFSFELYENRTNVVRKTALGFANSLVPPSTFTSTARFPLRSIPANGLVILRELAPLEEYFQIKHSGEYELQLRLRYFARTNGTNGVYYWKFSDQIRLPVVSGR